DGRIVHNRARQSQALLEAQGQFTCITAKVGREVEGLDVAFDSGALYLPRQAVGSREELEILLHAEIAIKREFLCHVAKPTARLCWRAIEIDSVDSRSTS